MDMKRMKLTNEGRILSG